MICDSRPDFGQLRFWRLSESIRVGDTTLLRISRLEIEYTYIYDYSLCGKKTCRQAFLITNEGNTGEMDGWWESLEEIHPERGSSGRNSATKKKTSGDTQEASTSASHPIVTGKLRAHSSERENLSHPPREQRSSSRWPLKSPAAEGSWFQPPSSVAEPNPGFLESDEPPPPTQELAAGKGLSAPDDDPLAQDRLRPHGRVQACAPWPDKLTLTSRPDTGRESPFRPLVHSTPPSGTARKPPGSVKMELFLGGKSPATDAKPPPLDETAAITDRVSASLALTSQREEGEDE